MRRFVQALTVHVAAMLAISVLLVSAVPALACSCVGPQPMAAYAGDPDQIVFTGVVGQPDAVGVPVQVTRWFQSPDTSATVWLEAAGFGGDGASCGTALPPADTEWIFVAYRAESGQLGVNLCTPHAAAADPAGQAMFADAIATFGDGLAVDPGPEPTTASPAGGWLLPFPVLVGLGIVVLGGLVGVALMLKRRPGDGVPGA